jgi:uncharacterized membrane protein
MKALIALATIGLLGMNVQADVKGYTCLGTEPFYGLKISGTNLELDFVGEPLKAYSVIGPKTPQGLQEGYVSVYKSRAMDAVISIVNGKCTDGMSDNEYGYHLVYTEGDRVLYGCCEPLAQD